MDQLHPGFMRRSPALFDITGQTGANDVLPSSFAAAASRHHVVNAEQRCRKMPAAVLAQMVITRQYVTPIQMQFLLGQLIESQQSNDPGHLNDKIDRSDPVIVRLPGIGSQLAHLTPRIERVGREFPFFKMNHLGQFAAKQCKSPTNIDHVDRHIQTIQHKHAARQSAAGGGGSRGR